RHGLVTAAYPGLSELTAVDPLPGTVFATLPRESGLTALSLLPGTVPGESAAHPGLSDLGPQPGESAARLGETADQALALMQAWLAEERLADTKLVIVTVGAAPAGTDGDVTDLAAAPVWGLIRSAQSEHPGRFALLDLDPSGSVVPAGAVLAAL